MEQAVSRDASMGANLAGRWRMAAMGTLLQVCLGTVYAWSYFQQPMVEAFRCTQSQAAWAFSLAIGFLGLAAAWGGVGLPRYGPARLAGLGGVLYACGYGLGALAIARGSLPLLYLGFGVVGGIGLGLGYVTPVATIAKWFPDKKGLATGMVVMGFGLGALVMSKVIAPGLMRHFNGSLPAVFGVIGCVMLVAAGGTGLTLRNPPGAATTAPPAMRFDPAALATLSSGRFALMWLMFFCNIAAGIMFIGFQSPMLQGLLQSARPELTRADLIAAGGTLIAVSSLFNGLGRLFWGGLSDRLGRMVTFRLILGSQLAAFGALLFVRQPWFFGVLVCYVLLCYGGGFGAMPSLVLDTYGLSRMPVLYGAMLTAWSAAGVVGPQVVAIIKDRFAEQASPCAFGAAMVFLGVGLAATLGLRGALPTAGKKR